MTHKIKVQMFGNFRMDYNGAPFVAEKMHKESQFNRMMQALIHYSDCGIAKDKLEEIVIGERDIDAPHTALRVIVYKTKQKLAQLGLPGKNLVYLEGGIYYWTPDIEIEEDAAEFEKLYNEACALEKQMPHEPESAETVCDERIKEIEDNMLELYIKALYLYKGEFLAAYTGETWIAQEARRYHIMFEKIINEAAYILRKRKQFKGLEKLGVYAAKVDPFNEWEELIMEAMVETRRYDEAEELYTDVVDYYLRECGIYPSSRLLEILEKYSNQMNHAHEILENIQEGMNEQEETERGGYFCSYPVFRGIYQASIRIMKRTRVPVYLMLCTLEDEEGRQVQSETKMNKYSRQLKKCVGESIRYAATLLMLHTNNEIDRAYYFTILRTPWGEQMEDGLLCNSMGRIVDRTAMLEKLLKKATQNNIRLVFYGGENSSIRNAMRLLNRKFDSCEWHEHLKENEIICDDNTVYIVSADADDSNGLEILANAGLENGENYFITQRFLHYTEGGFAL